jgi:hypothetical protein
VVWPTNETRYYPVVDGLFNLDPEAFGLSFGIFIQTIKVVGQNVTGSGSAFVTETSYTTGDWTSQT